MQLTSMITSSHKVGWGDGSVGFFFKSQIWYLDSTLVYEKVAGKYTYTTRDNVSDFFSDGVVYKQFPKFYGICGQEK